LKSQPQLGHTHNTHTNDTSELQEEKQRVGMTETTTDVTSEPPQNTNNRKRKEET